MYVTKFSIKNQQKIVSGIDELGFNNAVQWFNKFSNKEQTIVKIQLSSIDIEKVFRKNLFFKNELTTENNVVYEELVLEDVLDWNIFFPNQVTPIQLGHPIVLKRKLTNDDLFVTIYCFKGTLKAMKILLEYNSLPWSSKTNRTQQENKIISIMKCNKAIDLMDIKQALINDDDYEIIDRIYDVETMELLLEDEEIPYKDLINNRLIEFTESQDQDSNTYIDDYKW